MGVQAILEAVYNDEDRIANVEYIMSTPPDKRYAYYYNKFDGIQKVYSEILNGFLAWVFLIILVNRKNLKKPINILLILHYVFRTIGTAVFNSSNIRVNQNEIPFSIFPYTKKNWNTSFCISNIFWVLDELCADWYPLLRTKAVTKNNPKKIRPVIAICLIYNCFKIYTIFSFFFKPFYVIEDATKATVEDYIKLGQYKLYWWIIVAMIQVASFSYDLSVILTLRKCLFNKLKEFQGVNASNYGFLERFKQISEYRIMFSIIASISFLPFIVGFSYICFFKPLTSGGSFDTDTDFALENIRQTVININCNLMFIDQILLRFIVKRNKSSNGYRSKQNSSTASYNKNSSTNNLSYKNYSNTTYKNNLSTNSFKSKLLHSEDYYNNLYNLNYTKLEGYQDNSYDSETIVNPNQIHYPQMQPIQQFPTKYKPIIQFHPE